MNRLSNLFTTIAILFTLITPLHPRGEKDLNDILNDAYQKVERLEKEIKGKEQTISHLETKLDSVNKKTNNILVQATDTRNSLRTTCTSIFGAQFNPKFNSLPNRKVIHKIKNTVDDLDANNKQLHKKLNSIEKENNNLKKHTLTC